ncbi:MAG: hypothetical protein ABSG98_09195 [Anaerolineales bacterium]|jgi:hypothetical protein
MRVLDFSTFRDSKGGIGLGARLSGWLRNGVAWTAEIQMQDRIVARFAKVLGDEFVMLRNTTFPGVEVPIPLILVGSFGLRVMDTTGIRGTFRAKGDQWMVLGSSGSFKSSRPNLAAHLRIYGEMVRGRLSSRGLSMPDAEPVLVVARPETYIENIKSPVRIVLADGVENFATTLGQSRPLFGPQMVEEVVQALQPSSAAPESPGGPVEEAPAVESPPVEASTAIPVEETRARAPARGRLTTRHWLLLGLMLILDLCVLGILAALVVSSLLVR